MIYSNDDITFNFEKKICASKFINCEQKSANKLMLKIYFRSQLKNDQEKIRPSCDKNVELRVESVEFCL